MKKIFQILQILFVCIGIGSVFFGVCFFLSPKASKYSHWLYPRQLYLAAMEWDRGTQGGGAQSSSGQALSLNVLVDGGYIDSAFFRALNEDYESIQFLDSGSEINGGLPPEEKIFIKMKIRRENSSKSQVTVLRNGTMIYSEQVGR